ncbi:LEA type 2 family protein [Pseudomonas juntendi]|uniref:LEA type 2 family protein n=1 Tax=Pseudomonas juntendi TaxID=2666183 RepID=A0A7W2JEY0_9PSED|nr:LEA type 2 family protein [Pseudomonas juntendi]MBA6057776.1 LEA type 2 family protein [Pseudomonas juntendi]MBA6124620.1 LEA type 2 family protein [Pseudomonas juntendi]
MVARLHRYTRLLIALCLASSLAACALLQPRDPLNISVIGIEPLPGQELELRMAVKMRVQNPNEEAIDYNGIALDLEVNGQPLAAGVSDQQGHIGRYDEAVIVVPVSITAFSFLRQAYGLGQVGTLQGLPYKLRGKLASGPLGTVRFTDEGKLDLPKGSTW